ncbi:MAG TPA: hypothetical protein ENK23_04830 [Sorangium sp.]|nr:hypothetical protein [Sorangium sp.]
MRIKTILFAAATLLVAAAGCGDDETATTTTTGTGGSTSSTGGATGSGGSGGSGGIPAMPTIGVQIDRIGRPAINTAVNDTFTADATRNASENAYNANGDSSTWAAQHTAGIAGALAILDALDETCGNQLLSCDNGAAGCYDGLAGVLADDRLHIKADATACTTYLAVEAKATGVLDNSDCGGRKPDYDVIERSYSLLSGVGLDGVDDGVAASPAAKVELFPYLKVN